MKDVTQGCRKKATHPPMAKEGIVLDVPQIRELIEIMVEHGLSEICIREGDTAIALRKRHALDCGTGTHLAPSVPISIHGLFPSPAGQAAPAAEPTQDRDLVPIVSPMVGTFYASSGQDDGPFVAVGSEINVNTPVCIIEAMKVFNEISAGVSGVVERILVRNEQAVEFGQPMMLVRPPK